MQSGPVNVVRSAFESGSIEDGERALPYELGVSTVTHSHMEQEYKEVAGLVARMLVDTDEGHHQRSAL